MPAQMAIVRFCRTLLVVIDFNALASYLDFELPVCAVEGLMHARTCSASAAWMVCVGCMCSAWQQDSSSCRHGPSFDPALTIGGLHMIA